MTHPHLPIARRFLTAGGVAALLAVIALATLWLMESPSVFASMVEGSSLDQGVGAGSGQVTAVPSGSHDRALAPVSQGTDIAVSLHIDTGVPGDNSIAYIGDDVEYTIFVTNNSGVTASFVQILDDLPRDTLQEVVCAPPPVGEDACKPIPETQTFPDPTGGTVVVTVTRQLTWRVTGMAAGAVISRSFTGKVVGQRDGTAFSNRADVYYQLEGEDTPASGTSNEVTTIARVNIPTAQLGSPNFSNAPTWFSTDLGGTLSQDWGDFDQDGDLDLVLGSSVGTTVYRNEEGRLRLYWQKELLAFGVRWADINADGDLELVTVGYSLDGGPTTPSSTFIYNHSNSPSDHFPELDTFPSEQQFVRVEAGDVDSDGWVDLVVSTNAINADCPVRLYRNQLGGDTGTDFFTNLYDCISSEATANLSLADLNNDGKLDLAYSLFETQSVVFITNTVLISSSLGMNLQGGMSDTVALTDTMLIDASILFLPYDFSWGDFNGDGYMDLAAAYPLQREVRIYQNEAGIKFGNTPYSIRTTLFRTPLAVDWGDFDGDGLVELAVAGDPTKVYKFNPDTLTFNEVNYLSLDEADIKGQLWSVRAVDHDNDGDLDLTITNRDGPTTGFTSFSPLLSRQMKVVYNGSADSVVWGDANADGFLDLLFTPSPGTFGTRLFLSEGGTFNSIPSREFRGFGPHSAAFGDMNRDGRQDLAISTIAENRVYLSSDPTVSASNPWTSLNEDNSRAAAWGDVDDNATLDLLVGNYNEPIVLYLNPTNVLNRTPSWQSNEADRVQTLAWGDFNNDNFLDFAVGTDEQSMRVYRNNGDQSFTLAWTSNDSNDVRAVAWGDVDGDGDLDLAAGVYGGRSVIYENLTASPTLSPTLRTTPFWTAQEAANTTSIAWGDWDNDGNLDLALGNKDEPSQVYANQNSAQGAPRLLWVWKSSESAATTGVAWGDVDGDGDLDLAMSNEGEDTPNNGLYINNYIVPSHLTDQFTRTMSLPNNPSYVFAERPGRADDAYFYSSPEILSGPLIPTVTISYKLFDPDGSRSGMNSNAPGDPIVGTVYEYSEDGGSTWQIATPGAPFSAPATTTYRLGVSNPDAPQWATFVWDAQADAAISDNARFRVRIIHSMEGGRVQRASTAAITPPFRVRGLTCIWPREPNITATFEPNELGFAEPGEPVSFLGRVVAGSGVLTFTWDFDYNPSDPNESTDHSDEVNGELVETTFAEPGVYNVAMTVEGEPCPEERRVTTTTPFTVGFAATTHIYLPTIASNSLFTGTLPTTPREGQGRTNSPSPVVGLQGESAVGSAPTLRWQRSPTAEAIQGYRVYRRLQAQGSLFRLVAELPASTTRYTDQSALCGQLYYVTAFNEAGESLSSRVSYASLPCR